MTGYFEGGSFTDFQPETQYQLRIDAKNRQGTDNSTELRSAWSEIVHMRTIHPLPVAPGRPSVSDETHNSVRVSFPALTNDGAEEIYSYAVQLSRHLGGGVWTPWATELNFEATPGTVTYAAILRDLMPDTGYNVRVFARARTCGSCQIFWSPNVCRVGASATRTLQSLRQAGGAGAVEPADPAPAHRRFLEPARVAVARRRSMITTWRCGSQAQCRGRTQSGRRRCPTPGARPRSLTLTGYSFYGDPVEHALEPGTEYRVRVQANNQVLDAGGNPTGATRGSLNGPTRPLSWRPCPARRMRRSRPR